MTYTSLHQLVHLPTPLAAKHLLGQQLVTPVLTVTIIETEAYGAHDDPASHAFRGPTNRQQVMFGPPGYLYVYQIYGIHHCINIVAHDPSSAAGAVLIRSVRLADGSMVKGPGRVAKMLGITTQENGQNVLDPDQAYHLLFVAENDQKNILATPRIGIRKATDKLWRYLLVGGN